ncbi:MAG TPA: flagellar basal body P-ring formation chaperone FlgA [Pseudolabrys sp.]|jgi:flagella basal body P-ring formation protein FlgA|nr:flagellar basal body P-ring formation chaperone FlgA [Pseudolabrys sp.]
MIRTLAFALVTLTALGNAAAATDQLRPKLRSEATVTSDIVRVDDLVENAGIIAKVPIFRAPDLGSTGTVSAEAVIEAVREHALVGLDAGGITEVTVTRASRAISSAAIESVIARALSAQYALGAPKDVAVTFDRGLQTIQVEPDAKGDPRVSHVSFAPDDGRFDATVSIPTGAGARGNLRLTGHAVVTAEVLIVARPVERGEILKDADIVAERRPRADLGRDFVSGRVHAIGFAARGALLSGSVLRAAELMKPALVQRGESVTLVYRVPGITLTVRGKASEAGAEGDVISVLNEQTKRSVQGVVTGPGRVLISNRSPQLAANIAPTTERQ